MEQNTIQNQQQNQSSNQQGTEVASLVLGITSVVLSLSIYGSKFFFFKTMIGCTCGVIGLILGIASNKKEKNRMATAGIVLSIIGLILFLLLLVACSACALVGCISLFAIAD